ncbi:YadA-like family protein [Veillonella sp. VA139]|uniref:YadA-like family protein n=1 Tax=Veillonella sp. VA139 TaxID=741830 RepID=UPI0013E00C5D|nr:YadA-like family protein [Veillonella sp. VA139]
MKDNLSRRRKKYALGLLAVTAATIGTSFSPSAPWVMASKTESDYGTPSNVPPVFNPPVYNELDFDPDENKIKAYYYHVQAGDNVTVTPNTFTEKDFDGNDVTFNNFIVKANDTLVEDSDDIVVDTGNSENTEKGKENGVTRKYKLTLSKALKDKIDKAATGGSSGGAAPSKLEDGTNTTVEGDGTDGNKYKVNLKSDVTNITSISGDATNGLTLHSGGDGTAGKTEVAVTNTGVTFTTKPAKGKGTTITINGNGIDVSSKKITGLGNGAIAAGSTDAVTGGQLHSTNTDVTNLRVTKLDKTAERHIKPGTYNVMNGTVTLEYVNGEGNATTEKAIINGIATKSDIWRLGIQNAGDTTTTDITPSTDGKVTLKAGDNVTLESNAGTVTISAKNKITSVTSGNLDALSVDTSNGAVTVNPVLASSISNRGDANKLVTAGVVSTAITNATNPLAKNDLSNITDAGKKVITGLGTEVVQGNGVTVTPNEDATTGKKTYTISAVKPNFAAGTNTTLEGEGTAAKPYKYNVNPALTGITSITGDTGLTFIGAGTAVTINGNGVNVGGTRVTNLADAALTGSSTDAVTGKQLHTTNIKVTNLETTKLDKTAERHIKPSTYTVTNGSVTLNYVDGEGHDVADTTTINGVASISDVWKLGIKNNGDKTATVITPTADGNVTLKAGDNVSLSSSNGEVTISAKNTVKSIISGDANTLTVTDNNGDVTLTPVVATNITSDGDKNKLVTAGVVNTAITNATNPLAKNDLSNITDAGKKVITSLGTEVVQGDGVTVGTTTDATGKKTYTISAVKPNFANGTNTTLEGDGTVTSPYKYNVNPALTGITSITGDTGLTFIGAGTAVTINGNGVNVGGKNITNLADAALTGSSTDAVTGKQLHATNEKVEGKLDKTAERHIKPSTYTVTNGSVTLNYVDGKGHDVADTTTINGVASTSDVWKLGIKNNGDKTATAITPTADGKVTLKAGDNISLSSSNGEVTISAKNTVKSIISGDANTLTVTDNNGDVTLTPVVATDITSDGDKNKLVTASVVNTAITNATKPLADKNLSNITDAGKKMITGLGTKVVAGTGIDVQESEDTATGQKTYTVSSTAVAPKFANGTNTTLEGDGTVAKPYKYNVNPALTGITSITNATTADGDGTKLTIDGDKLSVVNKKGTDTTTVTIGKDGIDAGGKTITNVADPTGDKDAANKEYVDAQKWGLKVQNGDNAAEAVTAKDKAITLKASADTTDNEATPKKGLLIAKDDQGNITVGLDKASRTTLDNAANVGNTASDGRDGKAGVGTDGAVAAGSAGAQGPTGKDGLNGKDLTNKVNALRNGEAGTVVYTNAAGDRLVKANDGNYYRAEIVKADGTVKTGSEIPVNVDPNPVSAKDIIASLVSTDGSTTTAGAAKPVTKLSNIAEGTVSTTSNDVVTGRQLFNERVTNPVIFVDKDGKQVFKTADGKFVTKEGTEITDADELAKIHTKVNAANPMTLDNVASTIEDTTVPNAADPQNPTFKEKLTEAAGNDATKHAVVNVEDLHKATTSASDSTVAKGLDFYGDDTTTTGKVHRDLGTALKIQGADTYTRKDTDTTGTTNISVTNNASGDGLNVAMANTLRGITSITNGDGATDVASTTMNITGDGVEITNTQPAANGNKASKTTVTIGKDGINAGGTKITNVAEGTINETSTDVVIGKQLHATNTDVANLKLTKLDKTDDVHVQAGEYAVNDKTGTVELTLAKGENDTDTGKKVKISGIVTHAVLSNTMDAYELNIEGDENTTNKNSLKKGVAVHGSSNFTPDEATKNAGINIQAKATDKGFDVKLADTLTNMKGITFAPTTQGGASVSLTSTGLDNGGNTITNVAAGVNDTDAVNVSQLKNLAHATVNVDSRINRLGAQSAAMAGLRHLQYDPMEPTTLMAGVGTYKGQTALALGVAHYKNESLLFHAGASIGSDPNELMANAGVSWKFGSRSGEVAVKDIFRQGPISSSYALQDKVAALEAQNQMQKEEINELKAQLAEVLQYIKKG